MIRMRNFRINFRVSIPLFTPSILLGWLAILALSSKFLDAQNVDGPMHKVQLTQKGYIQFLRWELPVPEIHEFTFCLWMKSNDLKYPHSIFSYSKNERERLIRSWISSRGRSVHLEINGVEVFREPVDIREHRWYHICQSWENRVGRYALWLNGHLELQGHSEEMIDHEIPSGGDIVLGQEYTDFDKGLEEGIEGSVLGFNLLLVSAFNPLGSSSSQRPSFRPAVAAELLFPFAAGIRTETTRHDPRLERRARALDELVSDRLNLNWSRRIFRSGTRALESSSPRLLNIANVTKREEILPTRRNRIAFGVNYAVGEIDVASKWPDAPLGLQLVKLSYVCCQLGRGSPPIGGSLMLISWSRTPVKIFGGATIKNAGNECGHF